MPNIDQRHVLDEEVFTYQASRDGRVFVFWRGRQVKILKGTPARSLLARLDGLSGKDVQLVLAKLTGNFKRGNER
jgi:hypothetical protein